MRIIAKLFLILSGQVAFFHGCLLGFPHRSVKVFKHEIYATYQFVNYALSLIAI